MFGGVQGDVELPMLVGAAHHCEYHFAASTLGKSGTGRCGDVDAGASGGLRSGALNGAGLRSRAWTSDRGRAIRLRCGCGCRRGCDGLRRFADAKHQLVPYAPRLRRHRPAQRACGGVHCRRICRKGQDCRAVQGNEIEGMARQRRIGRQRQHNGPALPLDALQRARRAPDGE